MNKLLRLENSFSAAIIGYLALPMVAFWCGWFEWWVATAVLIVIGVYWLFVISNQKPKIRRQILENHSITATAPFVALAFVWAYLAGIGGFRPQHFDYYKHNLILNNLVLFDWPVRYADATYLCYYNAYYLVPALMAKIWGGVGFVHFYMFGWAWLGLTLLFRLLHKIGGWAFILLFVFFNSTETLLLIYEALKSPDTIAATLADLWTNDHTIELIVTPGGLTYPSHVESLTAVPQHAIGGWLATGLVLRGYRATNYSSFAKLTALLTAFLLYWSPFVAFGLLLIFGLSWLLNTLFKLTYNNSAQAKIGFTFYILHFIFYILISAPALLYYAGHVPMHDPNGLITQFIQTPHQYLLLATFLAIEAVFWGILIWLIERKYGILKANSNLVIAAVLILFALPFYHYGHFNDFMRRVSLPASMILCWGLWQLLVGLQDQKTTLKTALIVCLIIASILPIKHHLKWFTSQPYMGVTNKSIPDFSGQTIHYLDQYHRGEFDVTAQYLGDSSSVYWKYLARRCK
jgi:hypothetical protein